MNIKDADKSWQQRKESFAKGALFCVVLLVLSLFVTPQVDSSDFMELTDKEIESINHIASAGKRKSYAISMKFKNDDRIFTIGGINYQNFKHAQFKDEVNIGDRVDLSYVQSGSKYHIYSIQKGDTDYGDLKKVNAHIRKNRLWLRTLCGFGFFFCVFPLFFREDPKLPFKFIIIAGLLIVFVYLYICVGIEYVSITGR